MKTEDAIPRPDAFQLIAFGDSTTAPRTVDGQPLVTYCDLLQAHFADAGPRVRVANAGVGGEHTGMARQRFQRDVLDRLPGHPTVAVIQFGLNDAAVDVWKEPPVLEPRVSVDQYESHLHGFVSAIRRQGGRPVLMTPNMMCWTPTLRRYYGRPPYDVDSSRGINRFVDRYADRVRELARTQGVPLIDIHRAYDEHEQRGRGCVADFLLPDGMHPNAAGHRLTAERLRTVLVEEFNCL